MRKVKDVEGGGYGKKEYERVEYGRRRIWKEKNMEGGGYGRRRVGKEEDIEGMEDFEGLGYGKRKKCNE